MSDQDDDRELQAIRRITGRPWPLGRIFITFGIVVWLVTLLACLIPFWLVVVEVTDVSKRIVDVAQIARQNRQELCALYGQMREDNGKTRPSLEKLCAS